MAEVVGRRMTLVMMMDTERRRETGERVDEGLRGDRACGLGLTVQKLLCRDRTDGWVSEYSLVGIIADDQPVTMIIVGG